MSAAVALKRNWTPEEYLAMERASPEKHLFIDGEIFAMAGCNYKHDLISASVITALSTRLRGGPCGVHTADMRLYIPGSGKKKFLYSDGFVACGPEFADGHEDAITNPCIVVEVLSDSTEAFDRGDKFSYYRSIPTLKDYLLLSQSRISIEHFCRQPDGTWPCREVQAGQSVRLTALRLEIPAEDLYPWDYAGEDRARITR